MERPLPRLSILAVAVAVAVAACDSAARQPQDLADAPDASPADSTDVHADVPDGDTGRPDGTLTPDTLTADTLNADTALTDDAADAIPSTCTPNRDEVVARAEVPLRVGLHATFKVTTNVDVDTVGTTDASGNRTWSLAGDLPGDHLALVELRDLAAAWFAAEFPDGDYFTELSDGSQLLGIFQLTSDALLLHGVASPEDGLFATRLRYDPPVTVLAFPVRLGDTWSTATAVSGLLNGTPSFWSEDYAYLVDAVGQLATPFANFPVLRIRGTLERTVFLTQTTRSFLFVSECFGTVAAVTSAVDEPELEFTRAAEVRRLSP